MKRFFTPCLALLALSSAAAFAQEDGSQSAATNKAKKVVPISATSGALSDDQIAALKTQWTDDKKKSRVHFSASFNASEVPPEEKKKYAKSGKIPIRITADLVETKEVGGKNVARRLDGSIHLYVKDSTGKVVAKKSIPLEKMCPS